MKKETPPPPPKVEIFFEVDIGGEKERRQLPFVVGVLADLAGHPLDPPRRLKDRKFTRIDADTFGDFMERVSPRLALKVDDRLVAEGGVLAVEIRFRHMDDFAPAAVAKQIPALRALLDLRSLLNELHAAVHASSRLDDLIKQAVLDRAGESDSESRDALVQALVAQGHFGRYAEDKVRAAEYLQAFFQVLDEGEIVLSPTTDAMLSERIARIDDLLSAQLNEVFHHPDFQRLEASWRGLEHFVQHTATSSMLKIKVLCTSKKDILKDLERAPEFDQSGMFRLVYEEEYGTLGGEPFAALIGDYSFGYEPQDVGWLAHMSNVAAAANAPFIGAALASLFNLDSFRELSMPRDLAKIFDSLGYSEWHAFRKSEDSRYVGLVLPRVLMRLPYGRDGLAAEEFNYEEGVDGTAPEKYLWGNAVYAFATRLTEAFARYEWCASISGMEHGGVVQGLPVQKFLSDDGETVVTCPTEIAISDRRREELRRLGFIPLCYEKRSSRAVFFEAQSCHKPALYDNQAASVAAAESAKFEYLFAISRFAHYIRVIKREKSWQFQSRREWEQYLNQWLAQYVLLDEDAEPEVKARFPLREGTVSVEETPGRPGLFEVKAKLRPNFQLNCLDTGFEQAVNRLEAIPKANRHGR